MSELRLIPLAALMWAATALVVLRMPFAATGVIVAAGVAALLCRQPGQAIVLSCGGGVAAATAWLRVRAVVAVGWGAPGAASPGLVRGVVSEHPKQVREGFWLVTVDSTSYPVELPVMLRGDPPPAGAVVEAALQARPSERAGLLEYALSARDMRVLAPPHGWQAATGHVREVFAQACHYWLSEHAQGLVPGMVLGDVNMQSDADRQLYMSTGLSHLTAVSGSNVAIVITAAFAVAKLLTLPPRVQVAAAGVSLAGFVGLVGCEPSVLRAGVTGMVGLLAVINSSKMQPMHGLALAVCTLVLWDSNLAVHYGFALSVAATAGIVVLQPLLVPALARLAIGGRRMPDVVVRALGVAIAADVVTAPIIAMMTGSVPLVSVLANMLVAPVVGVITIVGLVAVCCALLPGGLEALPMMCIEPCAWWIHTVATVLAGPQLEAPAGWVVLGSLWVLYLFHRGYGRAVLGVALVGMALWLLPRAQWWYGVKEVPLTQLSVVVEQKVEGDYEPPAGTQVVVVLDDHGAARDRPTRTKGGIPVLYPNRDGEVVLYSDGTQHARDGRF